jgi:hypothetical protein
VRIRNVPMTYSKNPEPADSRAAVISARTHAPAAIRRLAQLMKVDDARISLAAATAILDRAYGRPAIASSEDAPQPQGYVIEREIIDPAADPDR